jgi:predicted secreted protein
MWLGWRSSSNEQSVISTAATTQPARRRRLRSRIRTTATAANVAMTGKKLSRLSARYTVPDTRKTK